MKPLICCMSAIVLLAASAVANADAKSDAAARAKAIAPFVEAETAIVVRIDLARVDPSAAVRLFRSIQPIPPGELAEAKQQCGEATARGDSSRHQRILRGRYARQRRAGCRRCSR